MHYLFSVGFRL